MYIGFFGALRVRVFLSAGAKLLLVHVVQKVLAFLEHPERHPEGFFYRGMQARLSERELDPLTTHLRRPTNLSYCSSYHRR